MKNKFMLIPLVSLVFLGCTKVIHVNSESQVMSGEPVGAYTKVPIYEPSQNDERVSSSNNVAYQEVPAVSMEEPKKINISPLEAFDKIQENPNILLLDVRMPNEIPQDGKIAHSQMIPLQVLGSNLYRLDKSKEIIVYCHSGNRSIKATQLLRREGFNAINMLGGIEAWKQNHLDVKWR